MLRMKILLIIPVIRQLFKTPYKSYNNPIHIRKEKKRSLFMLQKKIKVQLFTDIKIIMQKMKSCKTLTLAKNTKRISTKHPIEAQRRKQTTKTKRKINNKIRPKLLNFEFCLMRYSNDVFFALAERNNSIFSWKSGLRGTSSWVNDLVSLSFCSMASWTWLANTGIVLSLDVLVALSWFGRGNPATGGLCVSFVLNIFIFSMSDSFAGSSSSNLAATVSVCVFTLYCAVFTIEPGTYT